MPFHSKFSICGTIVYIIVQKERKVMYLTQTLFSQKMIKMEEVETHKIKQAYKHAYTM